MAPTKTYAKTNAVKLAIEDLSPAEYNSRLIPQEALAGLTKSMETLGLLSFPVVNKRAEGYRIVGGHQRIKALAERGDTHVMCVVVEFDDAMERQANFALNNRAIQGAFIPEMTKALLEQIRQMTEGTKPELFDDLRFDALLKQITRATKPTDGVDNIEKGGRVDDDMEMSLARSNLDSKTGRFYKLGDHVLYCGRIESVSSLKGFPVDRADAAITSIAEDQSVAVEYLDLMLSRLLVNTDGPIYIPTNFTTLPKLQERFIENGGHWSNTLMWYPPEASGKGTVAYADVAIPVLYGWREGAPHYFCGLRDQGNVFKLRRAPKQAVPVEVLVRCLLNSTKASSTVLDLNVGKGASVIAAEKTNRRLIGYVSTPNQMDAVRKRWTAFVHEDEQTWKSATVAL